MDEQRQPVIVEVERRAGGGPTPSRVLWGGRDLEVRVAGNARMGHVDGMVRYSVPVTCGGAACTLDLDMGTWTWTMTGYPGTATD